MSPTSTLAISRRLQAGFDAIVALCNDLSQEDAHWKPNADRWSVTEVLGHLADIEKEDFRHDVVMVLERPDEEWPHFDELAWVTERGYNLRSLEEAREGFRTERERSLEWLRVLGRVDLDVIHSGRGFWAQPQRIGDLFSGWQAHDLFHIRQLALLRYDLLARADEIYSPEYSGFEK